MTEEILQQVWDKQGGKCFFTGQPFTAGGNWAASLDRLNAKRGYSKDNVVLSAWIVNHSRGDLEFDEFAQMCSAVAMGISQWAI